MRTAQEMYDEIVNHLRRQGGKSCDSGGYCMYRGLGGRKCAIGAIIPNEQYDETLESKGILYLIKYRSKLSNTLVSEMTSHIELLNSLQKTHDTVDVEYWEAAFKDIARREHLIYTPPVA